jgi:hypothetical protein
MTKALTDGVARGFVAGGQIVGSGTLPGEEWEPEIIEARETGVKVESGDLNPVKGGAFDEFL